MILCTVKKDFRDGILIPNLMAVRNRTGRGEMKVK